jgi:hypothetical protein
MRAKRFVLLVLCLFIPAIGACKSSETWQEIKKHTRNAANLAPYVINGALDAVDAIEADTITPVSDLVLGEDDEREGE